MRRVIAALVLALATLLAPLERTALAVDAPRYLPYVFEPVWLSLYDNGTETAFFPSKGIFRYEGREMLSGGYQDTPPGGLRGLPVTMFPNNGMFSDDYTRSIFALIKIKVINNDEDRNASKVFDAGEFYLESLRGAIYRPHPFTRATTRRLASPGEAVYLTLGFEVPPGMYTLVYKQQTENGVILAEIWRYDININRAAVWGSIVAGVLIVGAAVGAVLLATRR